MEPDNQKIYSRFIALGGGKNKIKIATSPAASASPAETGLSFGLDNNHAGKGVKFV